MDDKPNIELLKSEYRKIGVRRALDWIKTFKQDPIKEGDELFYVFKIPVWRFDKCQDIDDLQSKLINDKLMPEIADNLVTMIEHNLKQGKEIKETIVKLAHAVGKYIPENSDLERIIYKWSQE